MGMEAGGNWGSFAGLNVGDEPEGARRGWGGSCGIGGGPEGLGAGVVDQSRPMLP